MQHAEEQSTIKSTTVIFDNEAKTALLSGAEVVAKAVGITLGPCGKTVLIQKNNEQPILTKDGVTVAKNIKLKDKIKRMGGDLLRDVAQRTNDLAGDGTTTSTVIAYSMMKEGYKLLQSGYTVADLTHGINLSKQIVLDTLKSCVQKANTFDEIQNIATISANGDKSIGTLIAQAIEKVGRDGIVSVDDAKGMQTSLEIVDGVQYDNRGYMSPYFVTHNDKMLCMFEDCNVLITDKKLSTLNEILSALEHIHKLNQSLLIIADDIEGEALQALVLNRVKSNLKVVAIKAPGLGQYKSEILEDIAILTSGQVISSKKGTELKDASKYFGKIRKVIVGPRSTTFISNNKTTDKLQERLSDLRTQALDPTLVPEELSILKHRIAQLSGGVAVLRIGGSTETEIIEKRYRVEDALNATKAALDEGYVAGGGITLWRVAQQLKTVDDPTGGSKIFIRGCEAPLKQICENANKNFDVIASKIEQQPEQSNELGYDARKDVVCNLINEGIIDPAKVERCAIEHATSIVTAFLSLDCAVYEDE